jgi:Zn ribbon nucleic-acid-binding protein
MTDDVAGCGYDAETNFCSLCPSRDGEVCQLKDAAVEAARINWVKRLRVGNDGVLAEVEESDPPLTKAQLAAHTEAALKEREARGLNEECEHGFAVRDCVRCLRAHTEAAVKEQVKIRQDALFKMANDLATDYERDTAGLRAQLAAAEEQLKYPDDPARSIAAMLARMSPEDKQSFNFCVKSAARVPDALTAERDRLKRWVDDLQSGMYVNCVYCGHQYGPGETTPVSMADALKAHVEQCPEHPMSALKAASEQARRALEYIREVTAGLRSDDFTDDEEPIIAINQRCIETLAALTASAPKESSQ